MKNRIVLGILLTAAIAPRTLAGAETKHTDDDQPPAISSVVAGSTDDQAIANILATDPPMPLSPQDVLNRYESEMLAIAGRLSGEFQVVAQSVQSGTLSRKEAENISGERYLMATMHFQLLSTWHAILERDLAQASAAQKESDAHKQSDSTGEVESVVVALPFASLQLNPALIKYLRLTPAQTEGIQEIMSRARRNFEPLMAQLQETRQKLLLNEKGGLLNEKEVRVLATAQATTLARLIVANSRMQASIYELLTSAQRKKVDEVERASVLSAKNSQ